MGGECVRGTGKLQLPKWALLTAGVMLLHGNPGSFCYEDVVYNHQYTINSNLCFFLLQDKSSSCSLAYRGEQGELMEVCICQVTGHGKFINLMSSFWMGRPMGAVIDHGGGETESNSGQWNETKVLSIDKLSNLN